MREAKIISSQNFNGTYRIYKLITGEYVCDCLSFLTQKFNPNCGTCFPFASCKHIEKYFANKNGEKKFVQYALMLPVSKEQKEELAAFGIIPSQKLTYAQAEFIVLELLKRQGITKSELRNIAFSKFLPLRQFGVEFEGGLGLPKEHFKNILENFGFKCITCGYDHTLYNEIWKLGSDSSVSVEGLHNVEIVTPKLCGQIGLNKIQKLLKIWNNTVPVGLDPVNYTCGCHIHIDAYGWNHDIIYNLLMIWAKIETSIIHRLIYAKRRNNQYAKVVGEDTIYRFIVNGQVADRYYSLNTMPLVRQNTVEFRHVEGTIDYQKVHAWIVFALLLVDSVFNGLKHNMISNEPQFEDFMDTIGLKKDAVPTIRQAREYLESLYIKNKDIPTMSNYINFDKMEKIYLNKIQNYA